MEWEFSHKQISHEPFTCPQILNSYFCPLGSFIKYLLRGDCEIRNAGMQNGMRNGSTKVKFSVTRSTTIYITGSGKLKLVLVCVRELQKLAIVTMKSLSDSGQSREQSHEHCCLTLLDPMLTEGVTGVVKMPWSRIRALPVWTPDPSGPRWNRAKLG